MKFATISLSLAYCCLASALPSSPSSLADSRLLLSAKSKPEVAAVTAAAVKPQQCVYADASKTGRKTIVCGDPAPPTLASLLQSARPVSAAEADDGSSSVQQVQARTFLEKCFGDKKKQEQVAVYVQQPEYHQQEHYQPSVQYVQQQQPQVQYVQQPQVQYLQPQIQYVQPQVQLVQPQVHVQAPPPQVHYVQAPSPQVHYVQAPSPQVHYVKQHQQHYVQAPMVHYVQPYQHPIKSLCQQDSYYGRSAEGYPVQMMRAVDAGQTVLMAMDDEDNDDDDVDDEPMAAVRSSSSSSPSDPTLAVVWSDEQPTPVVSARGALDGGTVGRPVPAFGSVFRPTAYRAASDGVRFREYPGDIAADFQQQLSQQQQQVHDLSGSLPQQYGDYPQQQQQQQQQLSYGFPGQMQSSSSSFGSPYGTMRRSSGGPVELRAQSPVGYPTRPAAMTKDLLPGQVALMRSNAEDSRRPDAIKSTSQQQQQQQTSVVATPKEVPVENNAAAKTAAAGNGLKNSAVYDRQPLQ